MFIDFRKNKFPENWLVERNDHSFTKNGLESGFVTVINVPLVRKRRDSYTIEIELMPKGLISFTDKTHGFLIDFNHDIISITYGGGGRYKLSTVSFKSLINAEMIKLTLNFTQTSLEALIDNRKLIFSSKPAPSEVASFYSYIFSENCTIQSFKDNEDFQNPETGKVIKTQQPKDFHLEIAVDFFDDLVRAPFNKPMFDQLFKEFKSWGVKRCHWIYYGGIKNGWWSSTPAPVQENAQKTFENVGDIFKTAVATAHNHDIELYGLIKTFDMGFQRTLNAGSIEAKKFGKIERVGGPIGWIADFPARHREFLMARKDDEYGSDNNDTITRIDLIKDDDIPPGFKTEELEIYISNDNNSYDLYDGPVNPVEVIETLHHGENTKARIIRLQDLEINEKYLALSVKKQNASFSNQLGNLVRVYGKNREMQNVTLGIVPKKSSSPGINDFRKTGVEFDYWPGTPSAVFPGLNPLEERFSLDHDQDFVAIAKGKDKDPVATLSPSFCEVRKWWLSWIEDVLSAGADGVELRMRSHHSPLTWDEYGFEKPVVEEFKKLYGIDILQTNNFDPTLWRKLRGEAYTQFHREARKMVDNYGKKLGLHISVSMDMVPEVGAAMNIHWNWQQWLKENLADSITMKEIWPQTPFAEEIMTLTKSENIPLIFCPYANNLFGKGSGAKICTERIDLARQAGWHGFQFYECAAVIQGTPDGKIAMTQPELRDVFKQHF